LADVPSDVVYARAVKMFRDGLADFEYPTTDWKSYWAARWQFTPTGSIKSQYASDLDGLPSNHKLKNKFVGLITMKNEGLSKWVSRKPQIQAWSSVKYEWAKTRAIYGCDLTNFVVTNLAYYKCEQALPSYFPVGDKANEKYVGQVLERVLDGSEAFCFDFEDFNSQHSVSSMRAVLQAYADVHYDEMSDDQRLAARWVIDSVDSMIVNDNMGTGTAYKANGTLFSGWRLTTFVNSVLNKVYIDEIRGVKYTAMESAHNGDDVIIGMKFASHAVQMLRRAEERGIRAQPAKCAFGAVAEFLRVDRRNAYGGQYLARAISTLMHSRTESVLAEDYCDVLRSNETRLYEFARRGGDEALCLRLRDMYIRAKAPIYNMTYVDSMLILNTSNVNGGLNQSYDADIDVIVRSVCDNMDETQMHHALSAVSARKWYGVADFAQLVNAKLNRLAGKDITREVSRAIYKATVRVLSLNRSKINISPNFNRTASGALIQARGTLKHLAKSGTLGLARLAGIRLDLLSRDSEKLATLAGKLAVSRDPMRVLAVIV
jgi:hypothetical protein